MHCSLDFVADWHYKRKSTMVYCIWIVCYGNTNMQIGWQKINSYKKTYEDRQKTWNRRAGEEEKNGV